MSVHRPCDKTSLLPIAHTPPTAALDADQMADLVGAIDRLFVEKAAAKASAPVSEAARRVRVGEVFMFLLRSFDRFGES